MKSIIIAILFVNYACYHRPPEKSREPVATTQKVPQQSLDFGRDIQPILESHCKPCHFDGGKMYARMPFDQGKTIVDFKDGILRRIKDKDEAAKIRAYVAAQK